MSTALPPPNRKVPFRDTSNKYDNDYRTIRRSKSGDTFVFTPTGDSDKQILSVGVFRLSVRMLFGANGPPVADFEPFRRLVCSMLAERPELNVVGEVSDGVEAIRKAEELRPDLILLDIGLPTLNGIEAARQIRRFVQECKIVFLSQESSGDVVQEAFRLGAMGYVVKMDARSDLLTAVSAVPRGETFASSRLAERNSQEYSVHFR
jgi:CheY-like chemotaxis protein